MNSLCSFVVGVLALGGACGCTITQTAEPVMLAAGEGRAICVIENPDVDASFLPAYKSALAGEGFAVTVIKPGSPVSSCALTSTYEADWSWDFASYMSHAVVVVYRNGAKAGQVVYDSPTAGFSLTTRIYDSTESKVADMVRQLFPAPASP